MNPNNPDTEELLRRATFDPSAREALLGRHRPNLKGIVSSRLDPRLAARVGSSDVVQEILIKVHGQLDHYLENRPIPYKCLLHRCANDRLADEHRRHLQARMRSVARGDHRTIPANGDTEINAIDLVVDTSTPSRRLMQEELRNRVRAAVDGLEPPQRDVMIRRLEGMDIGGIAAELGISTAAVKMRQLRAMNRLGRLLRDVSK